MADNRRAGTISIAVNGEVLDAKGEFTYNLGTPIREPIVGADRIHGFKETPGTPMLKGQVTDRRGLDVRKLANITDATITLVSGTGKTIVFRQAWSGGGFDISTSESAIDVTFYALDAQEV
jgi:tricorn protease-like protein